MSSKKRRNTTGVIFLSNSAVSFDLPFVVIFFLILLAQKMGVEGYGRGCKEIVFIFQPESLSSIHILF